MGMKMFVIFLALICTFGTRAVCDEVAFDNEGGDWLWTNSINWQGDVLPGSVDQARTSVGGTIVLDSTAGIESLYLNHADTGAVSIVTGGNLTVTNISLGIGFAGGLYVNGGVLSGSGYLRAGVTESSDGRVLINSGELSAGTVDIGYGGTGRFDMSGGSASITELRLGKNSGSAGVVTISNGTASVTSALKVGLEGNGFFMVSGGNVVVNTVDINKAGSSIDAQLALLEGSFDITTSESWGLEIGGDDTLHIEGGTLTWTGDHLADIDTLINTGSVTWSNGQTMLSTNYDASWTNGGSVLYADYDEVNPGITTVWASRAVPSGVLSDPRYDLGYIAVTHYPGVYTNGTGDSTVGIQQAIDDAYELRRTVLFPPGIYQISDTLRCYSWQLWDVDRNGEEIVFTECHTLWGSLSSTNRPVIRLAESAPLFDDAENPRPMMEFRNFKALNTNAVTCVLPDQPMETPENFSDNPASLFCSGLRGIDFDCNSHSGAVGICFSAAQGSSMENINVNATNAYAGIWGVPGRNGGGMNLEVSGGRFGLIVNTGSAGTVLAGVRLFNQTESALNVADFVPAVLSGFHIVKDRGPVITTVQWSMTALGTMSLLDGIVELHTNNAAIDNSIGLNLYIGNLYLTGSDQIIQTPAGAVTATGTWKRVREYVYTDQTNPSGDPPYETADTCFRTFNMIDGVTNRTAEPSTVVENNSSAPPDDLVSRHIYADLPLYEGLSDGTIDITQSPYNATADDGSDDRAAIQAAINTAETNGIGCVFIPAGTFNIGDTLELGANTVLFGVGQRKSILAYHDSWQPTTGRVVMVETADDADATTFLGFLNINARNTGGGYEEGGSPVYDRFDSVHWRAGSHSCYYGVYLLGEWEGVPTNPKHTLEITGNGGGRFYFYHMQVRSLKVHPDHREVYIEGTREPLWFYGLNSEITRSSHLEWGGEPSDANVEIVNGQNIAILGVKREGMSPSIVMRNCRNVAVYSSGAMRSEPFDGSGGYLQVLGDSGNILIANALVQKVADDAALTNNEPILMEMLSEGTTNQVFWPDGVSLYKRGQFNPILLQRDFADLFNIQLIVSGQGTQSPGCSVYFQSLADGFYFVESCTNLLSGAWEELTNVWMDTEETLEYQDNTGTPLRFYRVKYVVP